MTGKTGDCGSGCIPAVRRTLLTPFGTVTIIWNGDDAGPRALRIFLSGDGVTSEERTRNTFGHTGVASCDAVDMLAAGITRLLDGEAVEFDAGLCAFERCGAFQRIVLDTERRIPRGMVSTYAAIADEAESPGAARAVGTALARNPFPLVVPCHRAVRTDGSLGGFQGGLAMKRRLLEFEGVGFTLAGKAGRGYFHRYTSYACDAATVGSDTEYVPLTDKRHSIARGSIP